MTRTSLLLGCALALCLVVIGWDKASVRTAANDAPHAHAPFDPLGMAQQIGHSHDSVTMCEQDGGYAVTVDDHFVTCQITGHVGVTTQYLPR